MDEWMDGLMTGGSPTILSEDRGLYVFVQYGP
jgi:hypothetical protein